MFSSDHWVMDMIMEELDLNTDGMSENEKMVAYRRQRRELFNPIRPFYPVLQNGEYYKYVIKF
jgi:hypothetical protein